MALKKYKPITNGRRNMTTLDFAEITKLHLKSHYYNRYRKSGS